MASVEMEWTEKRIVDELRTKGPFLSAASADPWKNKDPDLESLNGEASEKINGLILAKRRDPAMALAGLILGETGSGKTHMLMRILQRLRGNGQYATFASVRAFLDPESVMRALLKEVVISLEREHHAGLCQLDVVMEKLVDDFSSPDVLHFKHGQPLSDARFAALRKMMPGINRDLLRCLLLHYETDDVGDKELLRDWIAYGLDGEDAKRFGLSERDLSGDSTTKAAGEEDARTMLISLGEVFAHARVPMVVCFDQLDGMTSPGLINAWGNVIVSLIGDAPGFLPLAFLRADTWNERFMGILDNAVPPRFAPIAMFGCTMDQARQLIRRRIEGSFGEGTDEAHRWLMERLEGRLKAGSSPRTVIQMAQRAIDQGLD
ncbi:MAG: ATP-binding protein, partial [Synergistaceae bacterium]|nr:ATP-binding protein [Synergistaceae bacterium]